MRLAIFSDLHSNLAAFSACMNDANTRGYDQVMVLGDMVGYGPHPVEVVEMCRSLESKGAIVLRGNHDEVRHPTPDLSSRSSAQAIAAEWTSRQLEDSAKSWLSALPYLHVMGEVALVHATLDSPASWHYASDPVYAARSLAAAHDQHGARVVLCGHVHQQYLFYQGRGRELMRFVPTPNVPLKIPSPRQWLATVGSVGQPRDGDPRANYAILDLGAGSLEFHRVAYDIVDTVKAIHACGLPSELASRLELGR